MSIIDFQKIMSKQFLNDFTIKFTTSFKNTEYI